MQGIRNLISLIVLLALSSIAQAKVEIVNHQPFAIRMPWTLHDGTAVMVDVDANGKQTFDAWIVRSGIPSVTAEPSDNGITIKYKGQSVGTLQWDIFLEKVSGKFTDKEASRTKRDFDAAFKPMPLKFTRRPQIGPQKAEYETWSAEGEKDGLQLAVTLDVYAEGFVDTHATLTNESAPTKNVYCAVLTRWQHPSGATICVDYDNRISPLDQAGGTPFRAGEGRHLFTQRGVDWLNISSSAGNVAWLNDFTPSFSFYKKATAKTPAHWGGANVPQLGQEAIRASDKLYSITEIARPNIKSYQSRFDDNILPEKDQPLTITSRLIIGDKMEDARVDQLFVAYTSYNAEKKDADGTTLTFGVPFVKFGTAYFPYSTLGENFEKWHMPGMSKETYWPLAADVVRNYKLFADDIKRDLRILKAMGFDRVRMHHLEMIETLDKKVQDEFLDFWFAELKHLGLQALLDVKLPPARIAELVKKYRPQVCGVEIDNEVLIFGIKDEGPQYWKDVYKAVKDVDPDMPVHLTASTNTGAFERIRKMGVPFDKVGEHAYSDTLAAISSTRDFALAVSSYATKIGKPPIITEWNWRFLTRMTEEDRAKVYKPIFENVFATRCMPEFYQFQFQESLAMSSKTLRGIRHYELLNLSRRPRPEALEFVDLIRKYGDPQSPAQIIKCNYQSIEAAQAASIKVSNGGDTKITIVPTVEAFEGVQMDAPPECDLGIGESTTLKVTPKLPDDAEPGFYHAFLRLEAGKGIVSYAWIEIRNPGAAKFDKEKGFNPDVRYEAGALDYDFNRDIAVVYPAGRETESRWDVESAWPIYQTLESATGRRVKIFQANDLPDDLKKSGNLIMLEMPGWDGSTQPNKDGKSYVKREQANGEHGDRLMVCGDDEASLNVAAIDLVLRYWKYAKDSGMRRIPLTDKPIEKGLDPSVLP